VERRFRSEEREGRQADRTTVGREDDWTATEEAVQVVVPAHLVLLSTSELGKLFLTQIGTKKVADFIGLDCSTRSIIANRTAEVETNTKDEGMTRVLSRASGQGYYERAISVVWPRSSLTTTNLALGLGINCSFAFSNSIP